MGILRLSIQLGELIDQRTLARSGRSGDADGQRFARVREKFFEQLDPAGCMILDGGNSARERTRIAGADF